MNSRTTVVPEFVACSRVQASFQGSSFVQEFYRRSRVCYFFQSLSFVPEFVICFIVCRSFQSSLFVPDFVVRSTVRRQFRSSSVIQNQFFECMSITPNFSICSRMYDSVVEDLIFFHLHYYVVTHFVESHWRKLCFFTVFKISTFIEKKKILEIYFILTFLDIHF